MEIAYEWLQDYLQEDLPPATELADTLTMHAYEVEEVSEKHGKTVMDIDVLPNRAADSLSHLGIAREVSTLLGIGVNNELAKPDANGDISSGEYISLSIDSENVRRATKRLVVDAEVGESPEWMQKRLKALDISPINNIVDITNYVMLVTGQPVHAFDYDKISGGTPKEIIIREAQDGEVITTLDDNEYELKEGMLVIADEDKPLDIAGIKGGLNSHIDEDTEKVMLSVCSFDSAKIRKTSQELNLRTDASKRFENNISPETVRPALDYLSALIEKHAGGQVTEDICEEYPRAVYQYVTGVSIKRVNDLLGTDISQSEAKEILKRTHCEVDVVDPTEEVLAHAREYEGVEYERGASVSFDAPDKFDCSSYTSYLFSQYGGVSIPRISVDQHAYGRPVAETDMKAGDVVFSNTGKGKIYTETQEFMPGHEVSQGVDHCGLYLGDGKIIHATKKAGEVVVRPLEDSSRFSNIVGIRRMAEGERLRVKVPYWRQDIRQPEDLIEEVGRVHGYEEITQTVPNAVTNKPAVHKTFYYTQKIRDILTGIGFSEVYTYAFQKNGELALENPIAEGKQFLRASLQPGLQQALEANKKHKELLDGQEITIFEIGKVFKNDEEILQLGLASTKGSSRIASAFESVSQQLSSDRSITDVGSVKNEGENIVCIDVNNFIDDLPTPGDYSDISEVSTEVKYERPSQFPYVLRDIALWVPDTTQNPKDKIQSTIKKATGDLLVNMKLFDQYDPEDQDRTSYAFRLVFQSQERTLEDGEVNEMMNDVYKAVEEKNWEVR